MSARAVQRTLNRLAYEVIERNRGIENIALFGILKRGAILAEALARYVGAAEGTSMAINVLDVSPYRDDLSASGAASDASDIRDEVTDKNVILVDDVLFTGRTARAALDAIISRGRPRTVQLAVLIDRGHREFPIQPDYVGRAIPTKYGEHIMVDFSGAPAVFLEDPR